MSETRGDDEEGAPMGSRTLRLETGNGTSPSSRSGERSLRRPLFLGSTLGLTALALGAGLSFHGDLKIPGLGRLRLEHMAAAQDARPQRPAGPVPGRITGPSQPAQAPAGTANPSPESSPDPRVTRALAARVHLQAWKASLWTDLRRLGVSLAWSQAGEPQWTVDRRQFNRGLRRLARHVERPPHNARLMHAASGFHTLPAHAGHMLDRIQAHQQLMAALESPAFRRSLDAALPDKPTPIALTLALRDVPPKVTADHLGSINTLLATFSTSMGGSSRNRRHNIQVACQAIDGTVLMPGDVFSYNETVGPRSEQAGFRTAPVIIHGELVPGTGGGVCQVSSTLYNVALLGDLKIIRRSHHQFPVHYVPPGRDATVAYGSLDLRFANSLPHAVALDVKTAGSRVVVRLYGSAESRRDVRLVNSRVSRTRPRTPAGGGPARPGKRVVVSRIVRLLDGSERREVISHDSYAPAPASARSRASLPLRTRRRRSHSLRMAITRHTPLAGGATTVVNTSAPAFQ